MPIKSLQVSGQAERLKTCARSVATMSMKATQTETDLSVAEADGSGNPPQTDERLEAIRSEMAKENVQAYIIPTEDPHMVCSMPGLVT